MSYGVYNKPYLTPNQIIGHLEGYGLTVGDKPKAEAFLQDINYYRFKIYLRPLFDHQGGNFQAGSTFEQGVEIYRFDDALRDELFSIIGRIEIKLRSKLDQLLNAHTSTPFWYLSDSVFTSEGSVRGVRNQLASAFQNSKDEFSLHFKDNYFNDTNPNFKQLPPFWVIGELMTFGNTQSIYGALKKSEFALQNNQNKLDQLANEFGANNLKTLNNWISSIKEIRNRCAHHSRVWNSNCRTPSTIISSLSPNHQPKKLNRVYPFVALMHKMDKALGLDVGMRQKLIDLFDKYPAAKSKSASGGFPVDWHQDPYWN
jgi:abortive infection bacteriophage resistance protein